jgi:hypothetical protein
MDVPVLGLSACYLEQFRICYSRSSTEPNVQTVTRPKGYPHRKLG